jgi:hypothetical protein
LLECGFVLVFSTEHARLKTSHVGLWFPSHRAGIVPVIIAQRGARLKPRERGGKMQTQSLQPSVETEIIARLLVQMEAAKRQDADSNDASEDLETWEWEGGATLN